MKLTDAAIWDVELRPGEAIVEIETPERAIFKFFEPAFRSMPWLHKARLEVVDIQAAAETPSWIVIEDTEDKGVFLLVELTPTGLSVSLVMRSANELEPATQSSTVAWVRVSPISNASDLLRVMRSSWGDGRHVDV